MKKNQVRLTESEFRKLITESVKKVLKEGSDYNFWLRWFADKGYNTNDPNVQQQAQQYAAQGKEVPYDNSYGFKWGSRYGDLNQADQQALTASVGAPKQSGSIYQTATSQVNSQLQPQVQALQAELKNAQTQLAQYKKNAETYKAYYDSTVKNANAWKQHAEQWKAKAQQLQAQLNQRGAQPAQRRQAQPAQQATAQQQAAAQPAQPQANGQNYNGEGQATYGS